MAATHPSSEDFIRHLHFSKSLTLDAPANRSSRVVMSPNVGDDFVFVKRKNRKK